MAIMARDILHKAKTLAGAGWRRQLLVAEACASTLHSLERLRGQVAAGIVG